MPKFLDVHSMKGFPKQSLRKAQIELPDEFVTTENMMFNTEADRLYCLLNAPNKEAVEKHYEKYGVKCEGLWKYQHLLRRSFLTLSVTTTLTFQ